MSQKMKIFKVFLLLCTLSLFNCQPEQEVTYKKETTSRKLNIWKYPAERIFQDSKVVKEKITSLKQKNIEARLTSSIYNFSIEESEVQVIYEDNYTQYSFLVYRDNPIPNLLENYICKVYHDGFIEQFLVSYPYTQDENGMVYDTQNATMQVIQDNSLNYTTTSRIPAGCVPEFVDTTWTYECVNVACSGPGSGSHIEPSDCLCGTPGHEDCTPPHTECNWMSVNIWTYSCPNNGGSGDTTGDTGVIGGGSTGTTTTEEEIITVPVTMNLTEQKFIQTLTTDEFSCYSLNTTQDAKNQIINYLNANKTDNVINPEALGEVQALLDAICENPNLTFDVEKSLKSPANIDFSEIDTTTPEGQKLDCIYKKLTNSPEFKRLFEDTFGGTQDKINVKFKMQPNLLSANSLPSDGNCSPTEVVNGNYYTVITINSDILAGNLEKANILIAKTIIHEYLHAYLNLKYLDANLGTPLSFLSNLQLEELMYYYFTPATEHNFMFNQMIPVFQNILSEIISELLSTEDIADTNNNPITDANGTFIENFNFMNFYKYIAYEGLHNSQSYMNDIESNPIEKRKHIEYNNYAKNSSNDCQ